LSTRTSVFSRLAGKKQTISSLAETKSKHKRQPKLKPSLKHSAEDSKAEDVGSLLVEGLLVETLSGAVPLAAEASQLTGVLAISLERDEVEDEQRLLRIRQSGYSSWGTSEKRTCFQAASSFSRKRGVKRMQTHSPIKISATLPRRV
jgi:hypothetical protein